MADMRAAAAAAAADKGLKRSRGAFQRELAPMMYGFGDVKAPLPETVALVESLMVEYVTKLTEKGMEAHARRGRLQTEDLVGMLRRDARKQRRIQELLALNEEIKTAKRSFDIQEKDFVEPEDKDAAA